MVAFPWVRFLFLFFPRHTQGCLSFLSARLALRGGSRGRRRGERAERIEGGETDGRWVNQITPLTKSVCISKEGGAANPVGLLRRRQMSVRVQPR